MPFMPDGFYGILFEGMERFRMLPEKIPKKQRALPLPEAYAPWIKRILISGILRKETAKEGERTVDKKNKKPPKHRKQKRGRTGKV